MAGTLEETFLELDQLGQEEAQAATARTRPAPPTRKPTKRVAPPKKPPTLLDQAVNFTQRLSSAVNTYDPRGIEDRKAVAAGIIRAPGQLLGGTLDTGFDAGRFIGDNIDKAFARQQGTTYRQATQVLAKGGALPRVAGALAQQRPKGASLADVLSLRSSVGQFGSPDANQFATELVASAAPLLIPGAQATLASRAVTAGAGAGLATSAQNIQDRAVNAALGAGIEVGGEVVIRGGALVLKRVIKPGTPKEAAKDALDRAFATQRTDEARAVEAQAVETPNQPIEAPAQEELPSGTRIADIQQEAQAGVSGRSPDSPPADEVELVADANTALERAGAAERLPEGQTPELTPDGRIKVAPETKAAVDEAGFGRAFAARVEGDEPPAVIFKEEASDGSSRVVGSMAADDLDAFVADVQKLRDDPTSINIPEGQPKGQWTMAHLGAPYDAASVLRAVVDRIPQSSRVVSDKELMEAAQAAADRFGSSTDEALEFARSVAGDQGDAATALKATQTIWARMGQDLDDLISAGVTWSEADDDLLARAGQMIHDLQMFSMAMEEAKSGAGRALRSLSLPDADTYLAALRKAAKDPNGVPPTGANNPPPLPRTREEMSQWMDMWDALKGDPAARASFLKGIRTYPSGLMYLRTAFANFFTGAILSGPKTIALNVVGPAVFGTLRTLERTAGGAVAGINPMLRPEAREAARAAAAHAPVAYLQTIGDVAAAFKSAARTWNTGESALAGAGANPVDMSPRTAANASQRLFAMNVPEPLIRAAQADGKTAIPYHLGNLLNVLPRAVWKLHGTSNEVALHMAYMGEVRAKAMLEAATDGLKGADFNALVRQRMDEAVNSGEGYATDLAALDSANRTTLVREPDPEFTPGYASFNRTIQSWRRNVPELRYVLPIFQVPANGLGETLRRIPGAGFLMRETSQELSGSLGALRQAEAYGRMMLGGGFLVSSAMLARNGLLTGAGPQDPKDRKVWLMTHQPYSLKVGDQWVAYDRLEPVGPILALAAGYYDDTVYRDTDRNMTMAAVGALAQYFKDKAAMQGIADILNFSGDPTEQRALLNRLGSVSGGFVPAFLRPITTGIDPYLTMKRTPWDYIKANLPGASLTLDPVRNILGEPVMKPQESVLENLLPVTTARISTYEEDPVVDEIDRLYQQTGYTPGMLSPAAQGQAHFDMRDVKLEDGGSLYNALMRGRMDVTDPDTGQTLRQALAEVINSPEYADAPDGTGKVDDSEFGPRIGTRGFLLQQTFTRYNDLVKEHVARESPIAKRMLAVAKAKNDANDVLRPYSAEDLAADPALMEALGIDLGRYEDAIAGDN